MTPLSRNRLAQIIAESLGHCVWDGHGIAACLNRRFPSVLQRFTKGLTQELLKSFPQNLAPGQRKLAQYLAQSPVFDRIHRGCARYALWPAPDLQAPLMQPLAPFASLDIPQLATLTDLVDWLLLTPDQLDYYSDPTGRHEAHGDMAVNHYHYHLSRKKSGGQRLIEAPKPRLKSLQRLILRAILHKVPVHANAYGFVPGRDCVTAAARHVGEDVVIAFDLRNYFQLIQAGRINGVFRAVGYPPNVAAVLAGLCTVTTPARIRDRMAFQRRRALRIAHLPQGAPTSPTLANLATYRLDCRLTGLAHSLGATYTRYADDLTVSGDARIKQAVLGAVPKIVCAEGFALNPAKTRVMPSQTRQVVTGIVVNAKTNVDRRDYDRLKAVIHAGHWQIDPVLLGQITGQIGWISQLNPSRGAKLRHLMAKV